MRTHTRSHAQHRDPSVSDFVSRLPVRKVCVFVVQCLLLLLLYCKLAVCLFNRTPKCSAHAFTHLLTAFKYEIKLELMYTEYCDYVNMIMLIITETIITVKSVESHAYTLITHLPVVHVLQMREV